MKKTIKVHYLENVSSQNLIIDIDEYCPHCKMSISPKVVYATSSLPLQPLIENSIALFMQCTRSNCKKFYSIEFPCKVDKFKELIDIQPAVKYTYSPHLENTLPPNLNETFPDFKKIYDQSLEAESLGLDEIAGVGYRKAVEFLIKEYVIKQNPEKKQKVESKFLGKVIKEDLGDIPKVQTLAQAAVWIGNDETHFTRTHEDKDLRDMKSFLEAAALFISANLKADEAEAFINPQES
ncbi:MAG: hypothetical protein ABF682_04345 [Liquorilactobacillus sp.]|uniref:hypothetical protein n=1 Tax=Liquorilactobacillus TaxID=2767888 RepID=UPI0039ECA506